MFNNFHCKETENWELSVISLIQFMSIVNVDQNMLSDNRLWFPFCNKSILTTWTKGYIESNYLWFTKQEKLPFPNKRDLREKVYPRLWVLGAAFVCISKSSKEHIPTIPAQPNYNQTRRINRIVDRHERHRVRKNISRVTVSLGLTSTPPPQIRLSQTLFPMSESNRNSCSVISQ